MRRSRHAFLSRAIPDLAGTVTCRRRGDRVDFGVLLNPSVCVVLLEDAHPKHLLSVVDLTEMSLAAWLRGRRPA